MNDAGNLDFGHYLAVIVVAAAIGVYHGRVLRADAAARPPKVAAVVAPIAGVPVAATVPVETHTPEIADPHSRRYVLYVTAATDDDVHQALANLPPMASYKLTPAEQGTVDGH